MGELERCPICGKAAALIHMVDSYDRADYGWDAGCASAKEGDGIHADMNLVRVVAAPSAELATTAWNIKAKKLRANIEITELLFGRNDNG